MLKAKLQTDAKPLVGHSSYDEANCFYYSTQEGATYQSEIDERLNIAIPTYQIVFDAGADQNFDLTVRADGTVLDASFRQKIESLDMAISTPLSDEIASLVLEQSDQTFATDLRFARLPGQTLNLLVLLGGHNHVDKFYRISNSAWVGVGKAMEVMAFRFGEVAFDE